MPQKARRDTVTTSIRLDAKLYARLRKTAEAQKRPASEIITSALVAALTTCPTCGHDHEGERSKRPRVTSHQARVER